MKKNVLVVDIGGTHVKLMISQSETRKFDSGMKLSPKELVARIKKNSEGWKYNAVSIGFPSVVRKGRIVKEAKHLAPGWIGWDFAPGCFARFGSKRSHGQSFLRRADILALVRIVSGVA